MIAEFHFDQKDRAVYEREFAARLPHRILDNHIHIWTRECLTIPRSAYAVYKTYKPWTDYDFMEEFTLEDCENLAGTILPGKRVDFSYFGLPFPQIDREKSNAYVVSHATECRRAFYYMPGQFEDVSAVGESLLQNPYFVGLKPYPDLVQGGGDCASIYDMLNRSALEFADRHDLVVILHIPRKGRMRDAENRRELLEIIRTYPHIRLIIAHVGRAFCYADVEGTIDFLKDFENVSFDTAFVQDADVLAYLMRLVPSEKIVFGSDAPLAYARGKDVVINNRHYYATEHPAPWGIAPAKEGFVDFTYYFYEQLRALLFASKSVYGAKEERHLENIFYRNALRLMGEKGEKIYA